MQFSQPPPEYSSTTQPSTVPDQPPPAYCEGSYQGSAGEEASNYASAHPDLPKTKGKVAQIASTTHGEASGESSRVAGVVAPTSGQGERCGQSTTRAGFLAWIKRPELVASIVVSIYLVPGVLTLLRGFIQQEAGKEPKFGAEQQIAVVHIAVCLCVVLANLTRKEWLYWPFKFYSIFLIIALGFASFRLLSGDTSYISSKDKSIATAFVQLLAVMAVQVFALFIVRAAYQSMRDGRNRGR